MKLFLKRLFVFVFVVSCIMMLLLLAMDTELIVGRKKLYMQTNAQKNYDLLVLGSSRAQHSFNPAKYNGPLRIFNVGEEGHGMPSNYLMLKVLITKYHVQVKDLVLQVDEFSFNGKKGFSRQFRDDFFVNDIDDPEVYAAFIRYRGPVHAYILKHFPFMANLIYPGFFNFIKYQVLSFKRIVPAINKVYLDNIKMAGKFGGYKSYQPVPMTQIRFFREKSILEEDDVESFEKLMNLCKRNQINIYLYRAPILQCSLSDSKAFDKYIRNFTTLNRIDFFDYKCMYQWPDQYNDQNHSCDSISSVLTKDLLHKMKLQ